jgi:hypothetical protein
MKIHVLVLVGEIPEFENCFLEDGNVWDPWKMYVIIA